jgi:hypothetical protein
MRKKHGHGKEHGENRIQMFSKTAFSVFSVFFSVAVLYSSLRLYNLSGAELSREAGDQ